MNKSKLIKSLIKSQAIEDSNNKLFFLQDYPINQRSLLKKNNIVNFLKEFFKKYNFFYYIISLIFTSAYYNNRDLNKIIKKYLNKKNNILNCGSGNKVLHSDIINVDLCNYPNVDVVADITNLPFKSNVFDLVINEATIEHVINTDALLSEVFRVLKKGGETVFVIPFIFPFHASPNDYYRWTEQGIVALFKRYNFKEIKVKVISGPASGFLGILIDFLSVLLSFNLRILYEIWFIIFSLILWPIKFLDILLNYYTHAKNSASVFFVKAKKL